MKKVPLKTVEIRLRSRDDGDEPVYLDYADTILVALEMPTDRGFTVAEMRARLPIGDRIEKAQKAGEDFVLLEDAQHKKLSDLLASYPFRISHYAVVEFVDAVANAPEVEVKEDD